MKQEPRRRPSSVDHALHSTERSIRDTHAPAGDERLCPTDGKPGGENLRDLTQVPHKAPLVEHIQHGHHMTAPMDRPRRSIPVHKRQVAREEREEALARLIVVSPPNPLLVDWKVIENPQHLAFTRERLLVPGSGVGHTPIPQIVVKALAGRPEGVTLPGIWGLCGER